ncbi:MAG: hypothetical protein P8074_06810 [Anaerolineales bacterium]|jgi:hypothetical protein
MHRTNFVHWRQWTALLVETPGVAVLVTLSWLGEVLHNAVELPQLTLLSPENLFPALVSVALFLVWWRTPDKRAPAMLLFLWGGIHLLFGAILSVLPLPFLPFIPEQTTRHYLSHLLYGLAQLPLLVMMALSIRQRHD